MGKIDTKQFVAAAKEYIDSAIEKADRKNKNGKLTVAESTKLPRDLKDNWEELSRLYPRGVPTDVLKASFLEMIQNGVGRKKSLGYGDQGRFGLSVRDNFENYLKSQQPKVEARVAGKTVVTRDITPDNLIAAHLKKFGGTQEDYKAAVASALDSVLNDSNSEEGLHNSLREARIPRNEIQAEVNRQVQNGHLELLDTASSFGFDPREYWIFFVHTSHQEETGTGFFAAVSRNDVNDVTLFTQD